MNIYEAEILQKIHDIFGCSFLDAVMPIITNLAKAGIFWIILAVVLLFFKKTRRVGITMAIAVLIGVIVCNLTLKPIIARVRPYNVSAALKAIMDTYPSGGFFGIKPENDFSFPSGHTIASFEGAVSIFIYNKKWGIPALILAFLIAFSRLYLCFHYPTDVLVAAILGIAFAILASYIAKWMINKFKIPCTELK